MGALHGGTSRSARERGERAATLSRKMRHGDPASARGLAARRAALKGIAAQGERQVALVRCSKAIKREEREEVRRLPERLAAVREVNQARAQYGISQVAGTEPVRQLLPGE